MKSFKTLIRSGKAKFIFFAVGIGATLWFLIRVIPKPSRAAYPCMRASAPFMSAFVVYLSALVVAFIVAARKNRNILQSRLIVASVFVTFAFFSFKDSSSKSAFAIVGKSSFVANQPIGEAKGTMPGRVVWVHNPDATNEDMTNSEGDYWFMDKNCNQQVVDQMLTSGIKSLTNTQDIAVAWDSLFKYFNRNHGKGNVGYTKGEKFAIKINITNSAGMSGTSKDYDQERMDAAPQMVLSILKQLIEVVKVPESDIWIGDNYRTFRDEYWDLCQSVYPDVHYVDGKGKSGREKTIPTATQVLKFSNGKATSSLPQHYINAAYFINIPCLKSHETGGITIAAKNHQGSVLKPGDVPEGQSAMYVHDYFPQNTPGLKKYRHLVDYMGHKNMGGKTLLYIVDGLWAGNNWQGYVEKWQMDPFNNDYPSSLFLSQDAVAIESVCFDFLLEEYSDRDASEKYPYMDGVEDYLKQAALPENWPTTIKYDPEGDGSFIGSLGVYEHWNNAADKKYSRNLGTGNGIELIKVEGSTSIASKNLIKYKLYPNPFTQYVKLEVSSNHKLVAEIFNIKGQRVLNQSFTHTLVWNASKEGLKKGVYFLRVTDKSNNSVLLNQKLVFQKI